MKEKFMRRAIELSRQHMQNGVGGPFGAIVVKGNKIVGEGWNQVTSTFDPTAHAEVTAIRDACQKLKSYDLSDCEIYTSCEPCPMCLSAIYWARIGKMYYANTRDDASKIEFDDAFIYEEIPKELHKRKLKAETLLRIEAIEVFREWETKADKKKY
ncbi:MAG: nucleoside deaminase [Pseudobdellovibrionaceae bacterium]